jgi:hypothetical protein
MFYKILLLLFEIGFGITLNIVGTISLSELLLVTTFLFYIKLDIYSRFPILKKITWLYLALLVAQIISEVVIGNSITNAFKGFAVTIVSYLHFIFLFSFFIKDRKLIFYIILGMLFKSLIFGTQFDGSASAALEGESAIFLKFYLAPILINILFITSFFLNRKLVVYFSIILGILLLILGARNLGFNLFLAGLTTLFILFNNKKINFRKLLTLFVLLSFISYGFYIEYVNRVLEGKVTSGNSLQIKKLDNPYNPLNLLISGRTETFVGAVAFADKPFFGHGAWGKDFTGKYRLLMMNIKDITIFQLEGDKDLVPSHSVLIGAGMSNGILAFFFMFCILYLFFKKGIQSVSKYDSYVLLIIYFIIFTLWNGLFSPVSQFRITLPLPFAFLLASYILNQRKYLYKKT